MCNKIEIGGCWKEDEKELNINCLELMAIEYALKSFKKEVSDKHVKILTDNTCAVTYLKNMGGSKSMECNNIANRIWSWCVSHNIWLTITHIPGKLNEIADRKSRVFNDFTEWMLDPSIFMQIERRLGRPKIDLFASKLNCQIKPFVSWGRDPEAQAVDAFTFPWEDLSYAFPPFCLIQRVLAKVERDGTDIILVAPMWTTAAWFPQLLRLLIRHPVVLPRRKWTLQLTHSREPHPLHRTLTLMAVVISGNRSKQEAYQERLVTLSVPPGEQQLINNMIYT